jgi:cytidylate kinase
VDVAGTAAELAARGARDGAAAGGARTALEALAADARAGIVISGAYYRQGDSVLFQADFTDATARALVQSVGPVSASVARPARRHRTATAARGRQPRDARGLVARGLAG